VILNSAGRLYVIAAPSGGGKTRLVRALLDQDSKITVSISHTTRPARAQDKDGIDYFFVDNDKFDTMIAENAFLEYAEVFGCRYGTSHSWVLEKLESGVDVILEIDWQGARQIKQLFPKVVTIFIIPPSLEVLLQRLQGRNQDSQDVIDHRMGKACSEIEHYYEFDYLLVNNEFDDLLNDMIHIVQSQRLKIDSQSDRFSLLLEELTKKH